MAQKKNKKLEFLRVYEATFGQVSAACKLAGCSLGSFYNWRKEDIDFNEAVTLLDNGFLEYVENKVKEKIDSGNDVWIWRWLKAHNPTKWFDEVRNSGTQTQTGGWKLEIVRKITPQEISNQSQAILTQSEVISNGEVPAVDNSKDVGTVRENGGDAGLGQGGHPPKCEEPGIGIPDINIDDILAQQ